MYRYVIFTILLLFGVKSAQGQTFHVRAKAVLQGVYSPAEDSMKTVMRDNNLLSASQPYNFAPFNYPGDEVAPALPAHTVDWVLLELRQAANLATVAERRAGLLLSNGNVVSVDGQGPVAFYSPAGAYYLTIQHRNHLSLTSATPVTFPNATVFDFTNTANLAGGAAMAAPLGAGKCGLWAGDFDADGYITSADYLRWFQENTQIFTNANADANRDGFVTVADYLLWKNNNSRLAYVDNLSSVVAPNPNSNILNVQIKGHTLDRSLQPVAGVTVTLDGQTTVSDSLGRFAFSVNSVSLNSRLALKYEKEGYFAAGQGLTARQNGEMQTIVCLVEMGTPITFAANDGLTAHSGTASVKIPASNGIKYANGQIYNGLVKAYLAAFSPNDPVYGPTMPGGDLAAINAASQDVTLQSIGIITVELKDSLGNELTLAKPAELSFQPPAMYENLAASLNTIPLWHYDETQQIWREEGVTTRQPDGWFKGVVNHFSWWNCDNPETRAYIKGCIVNNCTGQPAPFATITFNEGFLIADASGCFFSQIPANSTYQATSGWVSETIVSPPAGDTLDIGTVYGSLNVVGYGAAYYNNEVLETRVLIFSGTADLTAMQYSIDGQNFQSSLIFSNLTTIPDSVWVRQGVCQQSLPVFYKRQPNFCPLLGTAALNVQPVFNSLSAALQAGTVVFKLNLDSKPADAAKFLENIDVCPCIQELSLRYNSLTALPPTIGRLRNLQGLNVQSNQIAALPSQIGALNQMKMLILNYNNLTSLPPEIGNFTLLQFLYAQNNSITSLPSTIGNLTALKQLWFDYNQITAVPSTIGALSQLTELNVNYNQLTSLPTQIGGLTGLVYLRANNNMIASLPTEISQMSGLKYLYLNSNQLTNLPATIGNFANLQYLDASQNLLTALPSSIGNLTALTNLNVGGNQLTNLPTQIGGLNSLISLSIYNNQLTTLPAEICDLKDTVSSLNIGFNPGTAAMQAQWDACP